MGDHNSVPSGRRTISLFGFPSGPYNPYYNDGFENYGGTNALVLSIPQEELFPTMTTLFQPFYYPRAGRRAISNEDSPSTGGPGRGGSDRVGPDHGGFGGFGNGYAGGYGGGYGGYGTYGNALAGMKQAQHASNIHGSEVKMGSQSQMQYGR